MSDMPIKLRQDRSEFNVLFVHSELDDYGLDSHEFRIYAHLARRANGKARAYPGINSMAESCRMNRHTVIRVISSLEEKGLIRIEKRSGALNQYVLTAPSEWKSPEPTGAISGTGTPNDTGIKTGMGVVSKEARPPVSKEALKGNPSEGNPLKEHTAVGQKPTRDVPQNEDSSDASGISSRPGQKPESCSDAIRRKAFAVADRLEQLHWDNCKVRYSRCAAHSYVKLALRAGHDEAKIVQCYRKKLEYCHEITTHEMAAGGRLRHEKASPALTVWLARKELSEDGKVPEERWPTVLPKLEANRQRKICDDARVAEEVAKAGPAITAWFEKKNQKVLHPSISGTPAHRPDGLSA